MSTQQVIHSDGSIGYQQSSGGVTSIIIKNKQPPIDVREIVVSREELDGLMVESHKKVADKRTFIIKDKKGIL